MKNCKRQKEDITFDSLVRHLNARTKLKANVKLGKVKVKNAGGKMQIQILGKIQDKWNTLNWKGKIFVVAAIVAVGYGVVQGIF